MLRYEYKHASFPWYGTSDAVDHANTMGAEGWRIVTLLRTENCIHLVMERSSEE